MGRAAGGVKCFKLDEGDAAVFAAQVLDEGELLLVTDRGYAKRSLIFDYEPQKRNGKGAKTIEFARSGANGQALAAAFHVTEPFTAEMVCGDGTAQRFNTDEVRIEKRFSKGSVLLPVSGSQRFEKGYALLG